MIWFLTVKLNQTVYCQALGFTDMLYYHCKNKYSSDACNKVIAMLKVKYGIDAEVIDIREAKEQNEKRYCFPERIIK